ncbi:MAG: FkbM family methyltransferase [Pseudomonadota bacterium]
MTGALAPTVTLRPVPGLARAPVFELHDPETDLVSRRMVTDQIWEPFESELWMACLRDGDVVVDVGANLGYFSLLAACAEIPVGAVHAFEPAAGNVRLLRRNMGLNDAQCVEVHPCALGDTTQSAELHLSDDNLGDHQLYGTECNRKTESVLVVRGDEYLADKISHVDLLKVDTQGTECAVIRGLLPLLQESGARLRILLELTPYSLRRAGHSGRELMETLGTLGLPMAIVDHVDKRVVPSTAEALATWCDNVDATEGDEGFMNIFIGEIPERRMR